MRGIPKFECMSKYKIILFIMSKLDIRDFAHHHFEEIIGQ